MKLLSSVFADAVPVTVENPVPAISDLRGLFGWVINLILAVGFSLVVIMLALGFMQYIMSRGDKTAIDKAQQWVTFAAVGGVGLFLVFALRTVIGSLFGSPNIVNGGTNLTI